MARSQPPASAKSSRKKTVKRFSLRQANTTLPLIRRIVTDVVQTHELATGYQARLESINNLKEQGTLQEQIETCVDRLQELSDELAEVGCELKDYQAGLVDFVGRHEGRDVYLCWKLGEEHINYWHEIDAGFAARQPVSVLREID